MPLYEYQCEGGHRFEAIRPVDRRDEAVCPMCKKLVHRRMSRFNFTFGFRLAESSHIKGSPDRVVRDVYGR